MEAKIFPKCLQTNYFDGQTHLKAHLRSVTVFSSPTRVKLLSESLLNWEYNGSDKTSQNLLSLNQTGPCVSVPLHISYLECTTAASTSSKLIQIPHSSKQLHLKSVMISKISLTSERNS